MKNPDREILIKMYKIAQYFKASVRGDGDEIYNEKGEEIQNTAPQIHQNLNTQKWWKFW